MLELNIHLQPSIHLCLKKKKGNIQFPVLYQHNCLWASVAGAIVRGKAVKIKRNGSFPVCYYDVKWAE